MTNKDYVTFGTAKLLRKVGYPQGTSIWGYLTDGKMTCTDGEICCCDAPHLWDAMKWLREGKKLFVETRIDLFGKYNWGVCDLANSSNDMASEQWDLSYITYEEACDAGIAVACEWLLGDDINDATKTE